MITRNRQSTTLTVMPSLAQCLRIGRPTHAPLRRPTRVYFHQRTTSLFRFVCELGDERPPSGVINGLGEHSGRQPLDIQLFDDDQSEKNDKCPRYLVREIFPLIAHVGMRSLQFPDGFLPVITAAIATCDLALRTAKSRLSAFEIPGVFDLRPVRERGEGVQSHVNASLFCRSGQRLRLAFDAEDGVPLAGLLLDRHGFDLALDRAMQFDFDGSDSLQSQFAAAQHFAAVAVTGKGDTVIAAGGLEPWIARRPSVPDAAEERLESLIDAAQYILTARVVGKGQIAGGANVLQLIGLIVIVDRFAGYTVCVAALLKGGVIEAAGFRQLAVKGDTLSAGRVKPVFEVLPQLSPLLILYVLPDSRLGHVAHRADVITPAPKRRKPRFQERKFFTQYAGSETFELRRDVRRGQRRIGFDEHVNVIRHDLKRVYLRVQFGSLLVEQLFQAFGHRAAEDRLAVFRTEDEVVFESENRAGVVSITSVNHRKHLNRPLGTLEPTNAEFQERIALRFTPRDAKFPCRL